MTVGETIEFIRKTKNISLKEICTDNLSRQNYYRIIHNQVNTSHTKLKIILDRLHITFDEFYFIVNNFQQDNSFIAMNQIRGYFEKRDLNSLSELSQKYKILKFDSQSSLHMYCLINVLRAKLTNSSDPDSEKVLHDYLVSIETWTHYETTIFNNCMFIFSTDFINMTISKTLNNISKYSSLRIYGSKAFRMLINVLILFIERHEFSKANFILSQLEHDRLKDDLLFEKACLKFFKNIVAVIDGAKQDTKDCHEVIHLLNFLNSSGLCKIFSTYLSQIEKMYIHI